MEYVQSQIVRVLTLAVALSLAGAAFAQKVTFTYNPPAGTTYQVTQTQTSTQTTNDGKAETAKAVTKTRIVIAKVNAGYTLTMTQLGSTETVNGKTRTEQPDANAKQVYTIDAKGNLVSVTGLDALADKMVAEYLARVPENKRAEVKATAEKEKAAFIQRQTKFAQAQWKNEIGRFLGKTVSVGDVWTETPESKDPSAPTKITVKFAKMVKAGGRTCIQISETPTYDCTAMKAAYNKGVERYKAEAAKQKREVDQPTMQSISMASSTTRLVDPTTMLNYGETATLTTTVVMKTTKLGTVTRKTVETQEVKYEYK